MAFFRCLFKNLYVRLVSYQFPYKDTDIVEDTYEINGIIRGNITFTNVGVGGSGTWQRPQYYSQNNFNYVKLFVTRSNGGAEQEVAEADFTLTTTGTQDGQWRYTIEYADPQYIYTIKVQFVHIWWVNCKLTAQIEEVP